MIGEIVNRREIKIERVDTKDNIADPFTKAIARTQFKKIVELLGIRYYNDWP